MPHTFPLSFASSVILFHDFDLHLSSAEIQNLSSFQCTDEVFFFFNFFQQLFANASVSTRGTMILVLSYSQEQNLQMCNRHWVAVSKCSHSLLTRSTRLRSGIHHLGVSHSRACVLLSRALLQVHFTVIVNSLKSDIITVGFLISTFQRWNSSRGSVEMEVKAVF